MAQDNLFPSPTSQQLRDAFVGRSLRDLDVPAAILDVSKIKHSCKLMLDAVTELGLSFRAHVKTHKTTELTKLQVGEESKDVRLVAATVIEAESLIPLFEDYKSKGAMVNVLYGVPLGPSKVSRLAAIAKQLGPGSVSAMIDNKAQLSSVKQFKQEAGSPISVFIKTDSGAHRAGLPPTSDTMAELVKMVGEAESQGDLHFLGFYSHNSLCYNGDSPDDAIAMLNMEIDVCEQAAKHLSSSQKTTTTTPRKEPLVISVGASPSAISIQHIQPSSLNTSTESSTPKTTLQSTIKKLFFTPTSNFTLEIHAGVYPIFDLQQIAANSRTFTSPVSQHRTQALTILTEIASLYPTRTSTPEALVAAGTLALAREPCRSYAGWGVVTAWNLESSGYSEEDSADADRRVVVRRVSQEHGILGWQREGKTDPLPFEYGQKVRLWVNHACIASAGFGWYLIVDGDGDDVVKDVWVRWRGW